MAIFGIYVPVDFWGVPTGNLDLIPPPSVGVSLKKIFPRWPCHPHVQRQLFVVVCLSQKKSHGQLKKKYFCMLKVNQKWWSKMLNWSKKQPLWSQKSFKMSDPQNNFTVKWMFFFLVTHLENWFEFAALEVYQVSVWGPGVQNDTGNST